VDCSWWTVSLCILFKVLLRTGVFGIEDESAGKDSGDEDGCGVERESGCSSTLTVDTLLVFLFLKKGMNSKRVAVLLLRSKVAK